MQTLSGSVGLGGTNRSHDVRAAQTLLRDRRISPGPIDGRFGRLTLGAIVRYQQRFLREPDGLIEPNGPTWRRLSRPAQAATATGSATTGAAPPAMQAHPHAAPPPQTAQTPPPAHLPPQANHFPVAANGAATVNYTDHLPLPPPGSVNAGLSSPPNSLLKARLGTPRATFSNDCQPPTDARLKAAIATDSVGPFRVTGLRPAVASLRTIFDEVRRDHPDLYGKLGTAGMMCCRLVRGSSTAISNHSWGTAIDMKIDGALVPWRANHSLVGLTMLVPYFNRHGWFWGGGYRNSKDSHHFECGSALVSSFTI